MSHADTCASQDGRVLVVDDDADVRSPLAELLHTEGYAVEIAGDGATALGLLDAFDPDVVVADLVMPGVDGLAVLQGALDGDADRAVVVVTGHGDVDIAVEAMRRGAFDFVTKPLGFDRLGAIVERGVERRHARRIARAPEAPPAASALDALVGRSEAMQRVREAILQIAPSRATVLVTGESGTGKELVAAAIHGCSPRARGPFVRLHCAALAESLLESELFGHEKGAFTGADARREGRFMHADGGTLLLDEVGEISPSTQVKLLRFLQEHEFERVGGGRTLHVDVRVIAATHRDLAAAVRAGQFREDLYYRLDVMHIDVPPLRERADDIPLLAAHFLARFAGDDGRRVTGFGDDALARLRRHDWPGNVRELENAVERALAFSRGDTITSAALPTALQAGDGDRAPAIPGASLAEVERYLILRTLEHTGGSTSRAAALLGISARKIQYKLREYGKR